MNNPAVFARGLTKKFGNFTAVDSVDFEVSSGEIFGFLGPNGAGKSTTIRMLCGLLTPTSGEAQILGYSAFTEQESIRSSIGYMSQKFSLYDDCTPAENLDFFGSLYGLKGRILAHKIHEAMETLEISHGHKTLTRDLPAGIKQRLALSCATLHDPQILFLDEPTSGVDPATRQDFWKRIYSFAKAGKTVFITTHYMDEAEHCGRIALVISGKIIALDSPKELKKAHPYSVYQINVDDFVAAFGRISRLPNIHDAALFGRSIHVHISNTKKSQNSFLNSLKKLGVQKTAIRKIDPTLEDVFVYMAKKGK